MFYMLLVDLFGIQMDSESGAAVVVLREHEAPNRLLPIIIGGAEAASIALAASGQTLPRPLTHDVMATLVDSFGAHVDAAEVTDLREGSFLASLSVTGPMGERRVDARPSDAIALAVRVKAPLFVSEHVLDAVGTLPAVDLDEDRIDAEVDQFRDFLAELTPADFVPTLPPPTGPDAEDSSNIDGDAPEH